MGSRSPHAVVEPSRCAAVDGLGRRGRGRRAHRIGGRVHGLSAARTERPRHHEPDRRRARRAAAAADSRELQPADGPPFHRGGCADRACDIRRLLLVGEHAGRSSDQRKPRAEHAVPGDDRTGRQDPRGPAASGPPEGHHVCDPTVISCSVAEADQPRQGGRPTRRRSTSSATTAHSRQSASTDAP